MEHFDKWGRPLADNEVTEVAKMQKHIDDLEAYLENLWFNLIMYSKPMTCLIKRDDDNSANFFDRIWDFLKYCKENHPEIFKEIENKEQQERQELIKRLQQRKAKKRKSFLKRLYGDFLPLL